MWSHFRTPVCCAGLVAGLSSVALVATLPGCSAADGGDRAEQTGSVRLPLTALGASGKSYRIKNVNLRIQGPRETNLSGANDAVELSADLPIGDYLLTLQPGYQVVEVQNGAETQVDAVLVSPNPQSFQVTNQASTNVVLQFDATGDAISFGNGRVVVTATVTDQVVPGSQPLGACNTLDACDDFSDGDANGWSIIGGTMSVANGVLGTSGTVQPKVVLSSQSYSSVAIEADVRVPAYSYGGLFARATGLGPYNNDYHGYSCRIFNYDSQKIITIDDIDLGLNGATTVTDNTITDRVYRMRLVVVEASGSVNVDCYIDNQLVGSLTDASPPPAGSVGLVSEDTGAFFDNIKIDGL